MTLKRTPKPSKHDAFDWEYIINDAIERKDWFSGFTNSVTYFEHWGYWRLMWHCITNKIALKEKLLNFSAGDIAVVLYLLKAIDQDTYAKITKVITERNKLVHPGREGISYREKKQEDTAARLLNDAKDCIKRIKEGIGHDEKKMPKKEPWTNIWMSFCLVLCWVCS